MSDDDGDGSQSGDAGTPPADAPALPASISRVWEHPLIDKKNIDHQGWKDEEVLVMMSGRRMWKDLERPQWHEGTCSWLKNRRILYGTKHRAV